jgi:hypothetical protein
VSNTATPNPEASTESSLSKRTVANRLNAQKSTGPKTPEGKRKVPLNALISLADLHWERTRRDEKDAQASGG